MIPRSICFFYLIMVLAVIPSYAAEKGREDGYPQSTEFICPVGGEKFVQDVEIIHYPLESLPNGSVPGSEFSDRSVPECPGNGLVMVPKHDGDEDDPAAFAPYSAAELAMLPALVASPEYQALRGEARFYRLYWLAEKFKRPPAQRFHLLQHISWIGKTQAQTRRYLEFFVEKSDALIAGEEDVKPDALTVKYYIANALRQLGRFDEAMARINILEKETEIQLAEYRIANPENPNFSEDQDNYGYRYEALASLRRAITDRDDEVYPVSMMSDKWANVVCNNLDDADPPASAETKIGCAKRNAEKEQEARLMAESFTLQDDKAALEKMCMKASAEKRGKALALACDQLAFEDALEAQSREAEQMLKNPAALDLRCADMVVPQYATPKNALAEACQKRREVTREQEANSLFGKMRAQPGEYDRLCHWEYPEATSDDPVEIACAQIARERDNARDETERARIDKMTEAEIGAECARTNGGDNGIGFTLQIRCAQLEKKKEDKAWALLEADPAKLDALCSRFTGDDTDWMAMRCFDRAYMRDYEAARELAKDNAQLLADCAATSKAQRDRPLAIACAEFRQDLAEETEFNLSNPSGDEIDDMSVSEPE